MNTKDFPFIQEHGLYLMQKNDILRFADVAAPFSIGFIISSINTSLSPQPSAKMLGE